MATKQAIQIARALPSPRDRATAYCNRISKEERHSRDSGTRFPRVSRAFRGIAQSAMETNGGDVELVGMEEHETSKPVPEIAPLPEPELDKSSFGQTRLYRAVDISADKWLLTLDEQASARLENPPSLADGLDRDKEQVSVGNSCVGLSVPSSTRLAISHLFKDFLLESRIPRRRCLPCFRICAISAVS